MADASDMELLQAYDRQGSEEAFAELVRRHVNLVYSVALRHVGITTHAEEITQAVFVILARKAARVRPDTVLEGWLHETTRFTALSFLRGERRRQFREQEAYMQSTLQEKPDASTWTQLAPLLDEAVSRLGEKDRDALMLRFFKDKNLRDVATAMNVSEAAAQRRVLRAVEKLRRFFTRRGVVVPAAALMAAITANSVQAAPAVLAKTATAIAMAKGATASVATVSLIESATKVMAWAQAQTAVFVGTAVVLVAGTTTTLVVQSQQHKSQIELPASEWKFAGYGNPTATLQTVAWAVSRHDGSNIFASLSPDCQEEIRQLAAQARPGTSSEQFLAKETFSNLVGVSSIRILKTEVLWTNQVLLNVSARGKPGDQWLKFQKFGDEWKIEDLDAKGRNGRTGTEHPNPQYGGIGVALKSDTTNHAVWITEVLSNSPASKAGLSPGVVIQKINGNSMAGKSLAECVFFTRGRVGTKVLLQLFNPKLNRTNTVELTRHTLTVELTQPTPGQ